MKRLCDVIREIRIERGVKQKRIAELLGISKINYYKKEKGIFSMSASNLFKIAKELNIDLNKIRDDESIDKEN